MKNMITILIIPIILMVGCQPANLPEKPIPQSPLSSPTAKISPTKIIGKPTITVTPTEVPRLTTLESNCLDIASHQPTDTAIDGNLILYDRKTNEFYTYVLSSRIKSVINGANKNFVATSPDRKWLSYVTGPYLNEKITILPFDNKEHISIDQSTFGKDVLFSHWANNETLIFLKYKNKENFHNYTDQPLTLIAFNLFTQEKKELPPEFPDIFSSDPWGWPTSSRTLYSPDFHYVVYLAIHQNFEYALWDLQKGQSVASIETGNPLIEPHWRPDGKGFFVPIGTEFYFANIDGNSGSLTDLEKLFAENATKIRVWSVSPDSQHIAFFLSALSGDQILDDRLMVLDTQTGQVTNYCLSGDSIQVTVDVNYSPAPIWSPNGEALLVENRYDMGKSRLILVNLVHKTATQIAEDTAPFGWMLLPEQ
jgi:hypothetical protein